RRVLFRSPPAGRSGGRDPAGLRGGPEARRHPYPAARHRGHPSDFRRGTGAGLRPEACRHRTTIARMDDIFHLHQGDAPLLVSLPHDGTHVPDDIAARMTDSARRVPDTDWHVSRLYDFARGLGASII